MVVEYFLMLLFLVFLQAWNNDKQDKHFTAVFTKVKKTKKKLELEELLKRADVVNEIKRSKLEWAGHVGVGMTWHEKCSEKTLRGKKPLGRSKLR